MKNRNDHLPTRKRCVIELHQEGDDDDLTTSRTKSTSALVRMEMQRDQPSVLFLLLYTPAGVGRMAILFCPLF
jgi:hypothetical protein